MDQPVKKSNPMDVLRKAVSDIFKSVKSIAGGKEKQKSKSKSKKKKDKRDKSKSLSISDTHATSSAQGPDLPRARAPQEGGEDGPDSPNDKPDPTPISHGNGHNDHVSNPVSITGNSPAVDAHSPSHAHTAHTGGRGHLPIAHDHSTSAHQPHHELSAGGEFAGGSHSHSATITSTSIGGGMG
ncbi:uncharacterized protein I303_105190 [Kwoniella dejecticola CBS 10117]|uniref:Uncharacterized protein n=1 Tax=Kwoniella dejecticola CBS 10117 TaxID=1296121 RepID=A0A1A6A375_9TREE|nr:uncharacterized protein I303_05363 [Kwoniella dejecticola CBS 10117]OBR84505.1 hypothetical protein I303_05363 [Kwoniella dejecticola CBS 10117]